MTEKKNENLKFAWRIIEAHTIAYFFAGLLAMNLFNYDELLLNNAFSVFMRPITEPIVALGGGVLQLIRGIILWHWFCCHYGEFLPTGNMAF